MNNAPAKLLLLLLGILTITGCVRQTGGSEAAPIGDLAGSYSILLNDEEPHKSFTVKNEYGEWWVADDAQAVHASRMTQAEIEKVFGKEAADKSQCLAAYDGMATMIFCAAEPGVKATVHVDHTVEHGEEFTSKTGYFSYIKYVGIWDLEKFK